MEEPNYVLKTMESAWGPTPNARQVIFAKRAVRIFVLVLLAGSLFFGDNLFDGLSVTSKAMLIAMFLGTCFVKDKQKGPKPFEIRFYQDHLVLYREKRYYSPSFSRQETDKFLYRDIDEVTYTPTTHRLNIYGTVEGIWYTYNKDGTLPEQPSYHKTTHSIAYFYTNEAPEVDFVALFEKYVPIRVTVLE